MKKQNKKEASIPDVNQILKKLKKYFPDASCELHHETPFQLLIATILSAQCTDVQVNKVTPKLFSLFPTAKLLAKAPLLLIEETIRSTGFYKNKAKNIKACAEKIETQFKGQVPDKMEDLIELPGVGRKTANVVLSNAFHVNVGIVVDTHVKRIANLLGLTQSLDPLKIEQDLLPLFPQKDWGLLSHLLIFLGRRICSAKKPNCSECPLKDICPSSSLN
jgi:endonuclease-3